MVCLGDERKPNSSAQPKANYFGLQRSAPENKKLSRQKSLPEATLTMQAAHSIEQSFRRFRRFAWTSAFLSLLTGLSHVRTFPSYNIVLAVVALYGSGLQGDRQAALKSISVCAIIGAISIVADVLFCSFWAGEVSRLL